MKNNFILRTFFGALYVSLVIYSLLYNRFALVFLFGIFALFSLKEFLEIGKKKGFQYTIIPGILAGFSTYILLISAYLKWVPQDFIWILCIIPICLLLVELFSKKSHLPFQQVSWQLFAIIYTVLPFVLAILLAFNSKGEFNGILVLGIMVIIWVNDSGAYLSGITLGKHKLAPQLSPKKTWEGFIGGVVFSIIAGGIWGGYSGTLSVVTWALSGVFIAIFATLGDLVESQLKRSADIKDSGRFLPGHGGALDRFDSFLFTMPIFFIIYQIFVNLQP